MWDLNGATDSCNGNNGNCIAVVLSNGDAQEDDDTVEFVQSASGVIGGTLVDPDVDPGPAGGPIFGTISGTSVMFTFDYTTADVSSSEGATAAPNTAQGTRTYIGTINPNTGAVAGTWTETGSAMPNSGTWSLEYDAFPE
jgi:hypothetical protein